MWDAQTPTGVFVDWNGTSWTVKDIREIPTDYALAKTVQINGSSTFLDEIASRNDVYGEGHEDQGYQIFDFNIEAIADNSFDFRNMKRLFIPQERSS